MAKNDIRKVGAVGNSVYITFPKDYLAHLGITKGDYVTNELRHDCMIIRKLAEKDRERIK